MGKKILLSLGGGMSFEALPHIMHAILPYTLAPLGVSLLAILLNPQLAPWGLPMTLAMFSNIIPH